MLQLTDTRASRVLAPTRVLSAQRAGVGVRSGAARFLHQSAAYDYDTWFLTDHWARVSRTLRGVALAYIQSFPARRDARRESAAAVWQHEHGADQPAGTLAVCAWISIMSSTRALSTEAYQLTLALHVPQFAADRRGILACP